MQNTSVHKRLTWDPAAPKPTSMFAESTYTSPSGHTASDSPRVWHTRSSSWDNMGRSLNLQSSKVENDAGDERRANMIFSP